MLDGKKGLENLEGYCDSDWGSNFDGKSFSGHGVRCGGVIAWKTKKQPVVSLLSTEAELRSISELTQDLLWLKKLMEEFNIRPTTNVWCDNQRAIALCHSPLYHHKTRHINIRLNWIRDNVLRKDIDLQYVSTAQMWADLFTKGLGRPKHQDFSAQLGLIAVLSKVCKSND
ncbi:hypothetical protein O181_035743 [Austropuccinia psidii MF-1]|uniref:RNase H type-1 domain-containing protein n=1 Tax=Austropuccinia psidii MF-1 TaxID=1389203 RepID=A0A9Q3H8I8_9BASI|nr:hypothetical protein [Austropuccinia psidii MF-1]